MTVSQPATPTAFSLAIPPSWAQLDLHPRHRDRAIKELVADRLDAVPQLRNRRGEIVAHLRDAARQGWENGGHYCAAFVEPAGDGLFTGSLLVSILPPVSGARGRPPLEAMTEQAQSHRASRTSGYSWETAIVEMPAFGKAVRTFGIQPVKIAPTRPPIAFVQMHTFLPYDTGVALVSCASPSTAAAEPLFELFDLVTAGFRLLGPADAA